MPNAKCLHTMMGHVAAVNSVAVTKDGCKTISASSDTTVKIWNTDQKSRLKILPCLFVLLMCEYNSFMYSSSGQLIYTLQTYKSPLLSLALIEDILVSGASNGYMFLTNIISGKQLKRFRGHDKGITALAAERINKSVIILKSSFLLLIFVSILIAATIWCPDQLMEVRRCGNCSHTVCYTPFSLQTISMLSPVSALDPMEKLSLAMAQGSILYSY